MSIPNMIGPIPTNTGFMIVSIQNNVPYTLMPQTLTTAATYTAYYWESDLEKIATLANKIPVFSASWSLASVKIKDTINGGGLAFDVNNYSSNKLSLINSSSPQSLTMSQIQFANWNSPDIFLAKAIYTILDDKGQTGYFLNSSGVGVLANNIIILPVNWYFFQDGTCKANIENGQFNSIVNWFCDINPNVKSCAGYIVIPTTFTQLNDCFNGYQYDYCPIGSTCNTNKCNGPCSSSDYVCTYNTVDANFSCVFEEQDSQWWKSPFFIIAVILAVIAFFIIIGIIGFLIYRSRKSKSELTDDTS